MGVSLVIMFPPITRFQGFLDGIYAFQCLCVRTVLCKVSQRRSSHPNEQSVCRIKEAPSSLMLGLCDVIIIYSRFLYGAELIKHE